MEKFEIIFHPLGIKVELTHPITILDAAKMVGLDLAGPCGGNGKCNKCKVKITKFPRNIYIPPDPVSKKALQDIELKKGMRLACTCIVNDNMSVELPVWLYEPEFGMDAGLTSSHAILVNGWISPEIKNKFKLDPVIKSVQCKLPKPTLDDNVSDLERVQRNIGDNELLHLSAHNSLLQVLGQRLHEYDWEIEAVLADLPHKKELIDIRPYGEPKGSAGLYGVALDIGTSTIVAYLVDLANGEELSVTSAVNPQIRIGADIISRIRYSYSMNSYRDNSTPMPMPTPDTNTNGGTELSHMLHETIESMIKKLCEINKISSNEIYELAIVGNTTMLHNFLGLPLSSLGKAPYTPVYTGGSYIDAYQFPFNINDRGKIYLGPLSAGFIGADAVVSALVSDMLRASGSADVDAAAADRDSLKNLKGPGLKLILDIGTNCEILLGNDQRLLACSAAAGPAFEGGNLKYGMRAVPGAVYEVWIHNKRIFCKTISGKPAIGITGSGVVDALSEFLRVEAININGNINQEKAKRLLRYKKGVKLKGTVEPNASCGLAQPVLLVVPKQDSGLDSAITITQADIREVQLAKAAILTGIEILFEELGATYKDLDAVYLAGAFGNYLKPQSALDIKLLPDIPIGKIKSIGNSAGLGAKVLLRSSAARNEAERIAKAMENIELATHPEFQDKFIKNMEF